MLTDEQIRALLPAPKYAGDKMAFGVHDMFTLARAIYAQAIEDAASVCDRRESRSSNRSAMACYRLCASDIRALKETS